MLIFIFFFRQKTAYELRISDWSSDVCSSDLIFAVEVGAGDVRAHVAERIAGREPDRGDREDRGDEETLVHRAHDVLAAAETHKIGADDRGDDRLEERRVWKECVSKCRSRRAL